MREPEDVSAMLRLHELGWGAKRIAAELGVSRNTVRRYLRQGGWAGYCSPRREGALGEHGAWVEERFKRHRGNAEVVRQELAGELGVEVSLRTVERACAPLRRELRVPRRWPRCALKRPRVSRCRSTSAAGAWRLAGRSGGCRSLWPPSGTRGAVMCGPSVTSVGVPGSRAWKGPSGTLAGSHGRF